LRNEGSLKGRGPRIGTHIFDYIPTFYFFRTINRCSIHGSKKDVDRAVTKLKTIQSLGRDSLHRYLKSSCYVAFTNPADKALDTCRGHADVYCTRSELQIDRALVDSAYSLVVRWLPRQ